MGNSSTSVCADITDATAVTSNTSISSNETTVNLSAPDFLFSNEDHVKAYLIMILNYKICQMKI